MSGPARRWYPRNATGDNMVRFIFGAFSFLSLPTEPATNPRGRPEARRCAEKEKKKSNRCAI